MRECAIYFKQLSSLSIYTDFVFKYTMFEWNLVEVLSFIGNITVL